MGSRQLDKTHEEQLVSVHTATEVCSAPALPGSASLTGPGPICSTLGWKHHDILWSLAAGRTAVLALEPWSPSKRLPLWVQLEILSLVIPAAFFCSIVCLLIVSLATCRAGHVSQCSALGLAMRQGILWPSILVPWLLAAPAASQAVLSVSAASARLPVAQGMTDF